MSRMDVSRVTPLLADQEPLLRQGILELRAIAQMAEPSMVTVSPHNYNSTTVGLAATLHVSAAIPNFLPTAPELGVDIDEAALARYPARPSSGRRMPSPDGENP